MIKKPEIYNGKKKEESIFNNSCWSNWMSACRRTQRDPYLSSCTKLKSKLIKDLNIKPNTQNLIEEKVGNSHERVGTGNSFLNRIPKGQALRLAITKWSLIKLKNFRKAKEALQT